MTTITAPSAAPVPGAPASRTGRAGAGPWLAFARGRLIGLAAVFLVLLVLSFLIVQLIPGDPAVAIAGPDATAEDIAAIRGTLGLDRPILTQFLDYAGGVLTGDLGDSFQYRQPVETIIGNRLPFTAVLALHGIVVVLLVAVPVGMAVAIATRGGRRRWLDTAFGALTGFLDSVPGYIMATFLVVLFASGVGVLPLLPPAYSPGDPNLSLILPVTALAVGPACTIARVVRRETAVVLGHDYMRTARGWRLRPGTLHLKYALPNLLTTTLTLSGLILSGMLGGALIIENVFALPGLGSGIIKAILDRDYPVIQGMVLVIGMIAALVHLVVDVLLALVDSRNLGGAHGD
ncbi:ABC transporter permease [Streptomyces millisiae]|uniref:ABC transporter permease n=1 Tax=Streptomyces millisiae TaxID=3075542 RepID=A0ABU2LHE9_9ACTN|nr:ABC transporter permease [Streptomyces sp. DSM 44918]MDT0317017.1 ABC transporter permease [Streptomyces sp. DSM 44918]